MMFLGKQLTDWTNVGLNFDANNINPNDDGHNYYRIIHHGNETRSYIGLLINNSTPYYNGDKHLCHWIFGTVSLDRKIDDFLEKLYLNLYGEKTYSYSELDIAKQDIDNMIIKLDKLKAFL